jgi:hypothetical protein
MDFILYRVSSAVAIALAALAITLFVSILPSEALVPDGVGDCGAPLPSDNGVTDGGPGGIVLAAGLPWRPAPNQPPGTCNP